MSYSPFVIFHIAAGAIALFGGVTAMAATKGSPLHIKAGKVFFITMLIMSASGAYLAFFKSEALSVANGILTCYMVATGWMTVKRRPGEVGRFEWLAMFVVLAVGAGLIMLGIEVANDATWIKQKFPAGVYYFFASIALLGAALDAKMIYRGGVRGQHRIARHLWRMSFAMWMATTSFFVGQSQVFPDALRTGVILFIPVFAVLFFMFFWLVRVLFTKLYKPAQNQANHEKLC